MLRYVENIIKPSLQAWDLTTANLKRLIGENWIINMSENILLYALDIVLLVLIQIQLFLQQNNNIVGKLKG